MALLQIRMMSDSLNRWTHLTAVLPTDSPNIDARKPPYKTLYLLHGLKGDCMDWVSNTSINSMAREIGLAVVMPSGDNSFYVDSPLGYNDYGRFIGEEVVTATRSMFPLSTKREDTFIAGLSMGGYGALSAALKNPETFGYAAGLSSALELFENPQQPVPEWYNCFGSIAGAIKSDLNPRVLARKSALAGGLKPKIYMACGTEDELIHANRMYRDCLNENGFDLTYEEFPGIHDWNFWGMTIARVLKWLPL